MCAIFWSSSTAVMMVGKTEDVQHGASKISIPVLSLSEVTARLQKEAQNEKLKLFRAMYSSVVGGITTDIAAMVLPLDDHMVHRGHSVFDTAIILNGFIYELDAHVDRFLRSATKAKITPPFDRTTIREILIQTAAAGGIKDGCLRYWLSAGRGDFYLSAKQCERALFYAIAVNEDLFPQKYENGIKAVTSTVPIKPQQFATVKSTNYLPNALVLHEAEEQGATGGVWLDEEGNIAEAQNMNVGFIKKDGMLLLPPFDRILAGCTARRMLELVPQLVKENAVPGLKGISMQTISLQEAKEAVEMMFIGSGVMIEPVIQWDHKPVGNGEVGPITMVLRECARKDMLEGPTSRRTPVPSPPSAYPVPQDVSVDELLLQNATSRLPDGFLHA